MRQERSEPNGNEDERGEVSVKAARLIRMPFSTLPTRLDYASPPSEALVLARE